MAGRVSPRVGKVVLQHGNGRVTQANLAGGTFTIINDGPVEVERLVLVTYDRSGRVIDRRRPWPLPQADSCYTDPTGKVVVGDASSGDCKPAEAWR
jgi:hypothetical protein